MAPVAAPRGFLKTRSVLSLSALFTPSPFPPSLSRSRQRTSFPFFGEGVASRSGNDSRAHYVLRGSGNSRDRNARCYSFAHSLAR